MSFGIVVKHYEHHNRAMGNWDSPKGKWINSKRQYDNECARQGLIPYEQHKEQLAKADEKRTNESYKGLSRKAMSLIQNVHPDKRGNIRLSDRQIDTMKEVGVKIGMKETGWVTSYDRKHGGFSGQ